MSVESLSVEIRDELSKRKGQAEKAMACAEESVAAILRAHLQFRRLEERDFVDPAPWEVFKSGFDELVALSIRLEQILTEPEKAK